MVGDCWTMTGSQCRIPVSKFPLLKKRLGVPMVGNEAMAASLEKVTGVCAVLKEDGLYLDYLEDETSADDPERHLLSYTEDLLDEHSAMYWESYAKEIPFWKTVIQDGVAVSYNASLVYGDGEIAAL